MPMRSAIATTSFAPSTPTSPTISSSWNRSPAIKSRRPPTRLSITTGSTATGFLVIGPKMLAEDDPVKMEMDIIDEQVDTVGRVFMGLTLGCARCHDHKFDPIPTADYYALAGIFKSTKTMQNHKVVAMWNERALATDEGQARARGITKRRSPAARPRSRSSPARKTGSDSKEDLAALRDALAELRKTRTSDRRGDERRGSGDHEPPHSHPRQSSDPG